MHSSFPEGYKDTVALIKLLPSSVSKRGIWKVYHSAAEGNADVRAVAYATFCRSWRTLLPPMTDLCWTNSTAIILAENSSEATK